MKPIVLVLGLSGVGKTDTSKKLAERFSLLHIDMDRKGGGFEKAGYPAEWDEDAGRVDFALLAARVRAGLDDKQRGAVISFPVTCIFAPAQLHAAWSLGISTVILWGPFERCLESRRDRQERRGKGPLSHRWYRKTNLHAFDAYSADEYDCFRVEALRADGFRPSYETVLADIVARLADQGTQL